MASASISSIAIPSGGSLPTPFTTLLKQQITQAKSEFGEVESSKADRDEQPGYLCPTDGRPPWNTEAFRRDEEDPLSSVVSPKSLGGLVRDTVVCELPAWDCWTGTVNG